MIPSKIVNTTVIKTAVRSRPLHEERVGLAVSAGWAVDGVVMGFLSESGRLPVVG
jgi:hypothetical protein